MNLSHTMVKRLLLIVTLSIVTYITTAQVLKARYEHAKSEIVERRVKMLGGIVNNPNQLRFIIATQQDIKAGKSISPVDLSSLVNVIQTSNDSILEAKSFATLRAAKHTTTYSDEQKQEIVQVSLEKIKSTDPLIRQCAVSMLGSMRDSKAVPALLPMLNDEQPNVRTATRKALSKLGFKQ